METKELEKTTARESELALAWGVFDRIENSTKGNASDYEGIRSLACEYYSHCLRDVETGDFNQSVFTIVDLILHQYYRSEGKLK